MVPTDCVIDCYSASRGASAVAAEYRAVSLRLARFLYTASHGLSARRLVRLQCLLSVYMTLKVTDKNKLVIAY